MRVLSALLLAFALIAPATTYAAPQNKEPHMLTPDDQKQIAAAIDQFADAWKRRDMQALGAIMTEDVDWVNIVGMHWHGREQVVRAHKNLLDGRYKGVNVHNESHQETEIAPGVALVIWKSNVDAFTGPDGKPVESIRTMGTLVMLKQGGHWLIRSGENVTIDPMAAAHDPGK